MKLVALYKTFDGGEFVDASLASVYEHCDHIVMVHSDVSWLGERGNTVKPHAIAWCNANDDQGKVHHVDVSLTNQEAQYRAGIDFIVANKLEFDAVLAVDADEIWEDQYFENARRQMHDKPSPAYRCSMHTYLKNPFFRVNPTWGEPTVFLRDPIWLTRSPRGCQAPAITFVNVWMHHYTYVRETREAVERKLHQSCHADGGEQVVPNWMETVYDKMPFGESLHAFMRWRDVWHGIYKIYWPELPPAMRAADLMHLWMPEGELLQGECDALYRSGRGRKTAVDLGTYKGRSASVLATACERVHTVDCYTDVVSKDTFADTLMPDRYHIMRGHTFENTLQLCARWGSMTAENADTIAAADRWSGSPVDLLFVDADHSERATRANVEAWFPNMAKRGRIVLHDNNDIHPGVQSVVRSMREDARFRTADCGEFSGSLAAFEVVK